MASWTQRKRSPSRTRLFIPSRFHILFGVIFMMTVCLVFVSHSYLAVEEKECICDGIPQRTDPFSAIKPKRNDTHITNEPTPSTSLPTSSPVSLKTSIPSPSPHPQLIKHEVPHSSVITTTSSNHSSLVTANATTQNKKRTVYLLCTVSSSYSMRLFPYFVDYYLKLGVSKYPTYYSKTIFTTIVLIQITIYCTFAFLQPLFQNWTISWLFFMVIK
jgi:hypothetical protein